jgi:hypothetical protein
MNDAYYYTLATIAATFGSAVGIIVAATIFRIQRIDQVLVSLAKHLAATYGPADGQERSPEIKERQDRLRRIIDVQYWDRFAKVWGCYHPGGPEKLAPNERHYHWLLKKTNTRLGEIRKVTFVLVVVTLVEVFACFIALCFAKCIESHPSGQAGVMIIVTGISLLIICGYGHLIRMILQPVDFAEVDLMPANTSE